MFRCLFFYALTFTLLASNAASQSKLPALKGLYMGQKPPGTTPVVFAPGIVSTDSSELNSVFSSDGTEFFFSRSINRAIKIFTSQITGDRWSKPEMISFSKILPDMDEVDMFLSPSENDLYYISNRPTPKFIEKSVNIWYSSRDGNDWTAPKLAPNPINSDSIEVYPVFVRDGSMYLASGRAGGFGRRDVYRSQFKDGRFINYENQGSAINSEYSEGDVFVDPGETYLIVSVFQKPDSHGRSDLYISFKKADGSWGELVNMGDSINSEYTDFCPIVTPDGKYFFFSRNGDIYWVDASILERYRP